MLQIYAALSIAGKPAARWFVMFAIAVSVLLPMEGRSRAAEGSDYAIGPGDLLQIVVYGDENVARTLSGQFRVGPDGAISYPVLGRVDVDGLGTAEIGEALKSALAQQIPISGLPTVSVAEYAPVFVVGGVEKPGPYQFQPDMIVLQLIALAGGLRQPREVESRMLQLISAEQEIADLELVRFSLAVQEARLQAEINDENFDGSLVPAQPAGQDSRIVANEVAIFTAHRRARESQRNTFLAQGKSVAQEISSLEQTIALHDEEIGLFEQELTTKSGLVESGLAPRSGLLELQRQLSVVRRDTLQAQTLLARAQQSQIELNQRLADLDLVSDNQNMESLREVELNLARADQRLVTSKNTASQIRTEMNVPRGDLFDAPRYTVIRLVEGEYVLKEVNEFAELEARDILKIEPPEKKGAM